MASEWTEIADNAVKIGLGAIVGGGFSYLGLWKTHAHEIAKEQGKRRQDTFEKITEDFHSARALFLTYFVNYCTMMASENDPAAQLSAAKKVDAMRETEGMAMFHKIYAVEGRLKLLGFEDTAKCSEGFRLACVALHEATIQKVQPAEKDLRLLAQKVYDAGESFYRSAASHYVVEPVTIRSGIAWWVYGALGLGIGLAVGYCAGLIKL